MLRWRVVESVISTRPLLFSLFYSPSSPFPSAVVFAFVYLLPLFCYHVSFALVFTIAYLCYCFYCVSFAIIFVIVFCYCTYYHTAFLKKLR